MWIGVLSGFAGLKFSGSPVSNGKINVKVKTVAKYATIPKESFTEKYGWNEVLSLFGFRPVGVFDPVICNDIRWIKIIADKIKGNKKWIIKNRFSVAPPTENPPQSHSTMDFPI